MERDLLPSGGRRFWQKKFEPHPLFEVVKGEIEE